MTDASLERSALDAARAIVDDFGANRRDAYFSHFAAEATFLFHTADRRLETRAEYEALWDQWVRDVGFRVEECSSTNARVQLAGPVAIFTHDVQTRVLWDGEHQTTRERETIVLERRDARWVCIHEHLSPADAVAA